MYRVSQKKWCIAISLLPGHCDNLQQSESKSGDIVRLFCELYTHSKMVRQCIALTKSCATLTISLVTESSVGGLCAEENGLLAHLTFRPGLLFMGVLEVQGITGLQESKLKIEIQVYTPRPRNLDELEMNIRREVAALDP